MIKKNRLTDLASKMMVVTKKLMIAILKFTGIASDVS